MRKYNKAIITIFWLIFMILGLVNNVKALGLSEVTDIPGLYTTTGIQDQSGAIEMGNFIVSVIRYVGQGIAIVTLIIIGIRYVYASAEQKAEYKKSMFPYIIGAVLLFAGATFTDWIYEIFYDYSSF